MNLIGILSSQIDGVWGKVEPLINNALEYSDGKYLAEDIKAYLEAREMQLWLVVDKDIKGCAVTQLVTFPRKKVCLFVIVSGNDLKQWLDLGKIIESWALEKGCDDIEANCRPGWRRITNWERIYVVLRKKIKQ